MIINRMVTEGFSENMAVGPVKNEPRRYLRTEQPRSGCLDGRVV